MRLRLPVTTCLALCLVAAAPLAASAAPVPGAPVAVSDGGASNGDASDGGASDGGTQRVDVVVPSATGGLARTASRDALLADDAAGAGRVETPVVESDGFQTVGLTWPAAADAAGLDPRVRVRTDGMWSAWQAFELEDDAVTPGSPDAQRQRGGTAPLYVGDADAAQLSFAVQATPGPDGMRLVLIDAGDAPVSADVAGRIPGTSATAAAGSASAAASAGGLQADAPLTPFVITREQWGARQPSCASTIGSGLVGAVVHHTAGSNDYATVADAMAQIRGDQRYHIEDKGWCDIGYNFLVDKWGNIYEGRDDSLTRPVVGSHTGGANTGAVGVAMLGTYTTETPSAATQASVAQIIGWRLGAYGIDPTGTRTYIAADGSKFPLGSSQTLPVVAGHRDFGATECPGDAGYALLPSLRTAAATVAAQPGIPPDIPYTDITPTNPFLGDISWLKGTGITTGFPDGTFQPAGSVTREAMAAFIYRYIHGGSWIPACTGDVRRFTDVTAANPFCGAVESLATDGIVHGWADGTFQPSQPVSRQAMAAFLYRFATATPDVPACVDGPRRFVDVPVADPFCGAEEWLGTTGVSTGWADGTYRPGENISREAMAAFLHRLDTFLRKK